MQYVKLQMGCLLVILYIIVTYVITALNKNIKHNRLFDALMIVAPWAVFFDGFTAWTINNQDIVSDVINRTAHLMFYIFMDAVIVITTLYMYDQIVGFSKKHKKRDMLLLVPGIVSFIGILAGIGSVEYISGSGTNYSMGFSVYICFISLFFHYGIILYLVIARKSFLPQEKTWETLSFILLVGTGLLIQIIFPEVLITAICPTVLLLGIYMDFENPSIRKLTQYNENMVESFATLVENRDNNTGGHIKRTREYVELMLHKMRHDERYKDIVNKDYLINVSNAAPLHDIGKVATPDSILQKPGKLTAEEYDIMKKHAKCGGDIILSTFGNIDNQEFRKIAYEVARYHHEKYNGQGYPDGLSGRQIPLHARVMAIADVFDAVSQKRCYREAMPIDECFEIIRNGSGTDFDPELTELFLESEKEIIKLMKRNE